MEIKRWLLARLPRPLVILLLIFGQGCGMIVVFILFAGFVTVAIGILDIIFGESGIVWGALFVVGLAMAISTYREIDDNLPKREKKQD